MEWRHLANDFLVYTARTMFNHIGKIILISEHDTYSGKDETDEYDIDVEVLLVY